MINSHQSNSGSKGFTWLHTTVLQGVKSGQVLKVGSVKQKVKQRPVEEGRLLTGSTAHTQLASDPRPTCLVMVLPIEGWVSLHHHLGTKKTKRHIHALRLMWWRQFFN